MTKETFLKARTFLRRNQVKLVEADGGFLLFTVGPKKHEVWRYGNGVWNCNALRNVKIFNGINKYGLRTYRTEKRGCPLFNVGKNCSHIRACKMYLKQYEDKKKALKEEDKWLKQ